MTQHPLQGTPAAHAANKPVQTMSGFVAAHTVGHKSFAVLFMWVFPKIGVFTPQIIHLFIGFSLMFTIHSGVPLFLETPMSLRPYFPGGVRISNSSWSLVPYRLEAVLQTKFRGSDGTNTHGSNEMSDTQSFFGWLPSREQSKHTTNQLANQSGQDLTLSDLLTRLCYWTPVTAQVSANEVEVNGDRHPLSSLDLNMPQHAVSQGCGFCMSWHFETFRTSSSRIVLNPRHTMTK